MSVTASAKAYLEAELRAGKRVFASNVMRRFGISQRDISAILTSIRFEGILEVEQEYEPVYVIPQPAGARHGNQPAGVRHKNQLAGARHRNQPAGARHENQLAATQPVRREDITNQDLTVTQRRNMTRPDKIVAAMACDCLDLFHTFGDVTIVALCRCGWTPEQVNRYGAEAKDQFIRVLGGRSKFWDSLEDFEAA